MANNYFQFKQFRIEQNCASMKVGTDGCLLGAWAYVENIKNALDIGTGTGLIALMLAQRSTATIHAIDIDENAISDATKNFSASKWNKRLNVYQSAIQDFIPISSLKYDCILSNPPFFVNSEKSPTKGRTFARHTDSLSFEDLLNAVSKRLTSNGKFSLILPYESSLHFIKLAQTVNLYPSRITNVLPKPSKQAKRTLMEFQFKQTTFEIKELTIETEVRHQYTPEFTLLLKEFYLFL